MPDAKSDERVEEIRARYKGWCRDSGSNSTVPEATWREIADLLCCYDAQAATIKEQEQRIAELEARIENLRTIECEDFRPPASCLTEFLPEAYCKRCKILALDDEAAKSPR